MLAIVAEKTGYPEDMLDLELDLEADLGVDTVKQAETFAAVREEYGIPREEDLKLRDFPTLSHVVGFVRDRRPDLKPNATDPAPQATATAPASAAAPATPAGGLDGVSQKVLEIVADKTGYPPDMLDMDLDLEADLGVDTVKQAETFAAVREEYGIPREEDLKLRDFPTLKHVVGFVRDRRPDLKPTPPDSDPAPGPGAGAPGRSRRRGGRPRVPSRFGGHTGWRRSRRPQGARDRGRQDRLPADMLDMDLDLEADLGVDTVKQAETFAAVRQAWDIPRDENLQLRDFPTLTTSWASCSSTGPTSPTEPRPPTRRRHRRPPPKPQRPRHWGRVASRKPTPSRDASRFPRCAPRWRCADPRRSCSEKASASCWHRTRAA